MNRYIKYLIMVMMVLMSIVPQVSAESLSERLSDKTQRDKAITEIYAQKEKAVPELLNMITSKTEKMKKDKKEFEKERNAKVTATILLGRIKAEDAQEIIRNNLQKDKDEFVREASALALMEMFGENQKTGVRSQNSEEKTTTIEALKKALDDKSGNVRMRAILALAKIRKTGDSGQETAVREKINIENLKERALAGIKSENTTESFLAVDALEAIADKSLIPILSQNLESKNVWTKIHSKLAIKKIELSQLSKNEKLKYLQKTLEDEQFEVSRWAGEMLMKDGSEQAKKILKETAKTGNEMGQYTANKILWKMSLIKNKMEKNK